MKCQRFFPILASVALLGSCGKPGSLRLVENDSAPIKVDSGRSVKRPYVTLNADRSVLRKLDYGGERFELTITLVNPTAHRVVIPGNSDVFERWDFDYVEHVRKVKWTDAEGNQKSSSYEFSIWDDQVDYLEPNSQIVYRMSQHGVAGRQYTYQFGSPDVFPPVEISFEGIAD